ncbi:hypothetical protein PVL29_012158 [Vitis rotundifolia]|uniref:Uncharacterized protein n=1 Tax=Vitis rotundifolia TaxID=103349 RepID=A0AA38ZQG3_VITRO|nr:hypothetical protein PVL29_012158 [Vitis rotundifolia]
MRKIREKEKGKVVRNFIAPDFIKKLIFSLFHFLGLSNFLETDVSRSKTQTQVLEYPSVSAVLIREILPMMKFGEAVCGGDALESCAICLNDFKKTCLLCRTSFVPDEMQDEFNQRLWAASRITDFYSKYGTVSGL